MWTSMRVDETEIEDATQACSLQPLPRSVHREREFGTMATYHPLAWPRRHGRHEAQLNLIF